MSSNYVIAKAVCCSILREIPWMYEEDMPEFAGLPDIVICSE
jgi:hypothetical protein